MNLSNENIIKYLQILQQQRQTLLNALIHTDPLVIGSVYHVLRRCGNPYCHCAEKPSHRQTLLSYTYKGKRKCRFVRHKDEEYMQKVWESYARYKKGLRKIQAINFKEKRFLMAYMRTREVNFKK